MQRLVVTGASGAVGLEFVSRALRAWPDVEVICLVRSYRARAAVIAAAGEMAGKAGQADARLRFAIADLTDDASLEDAAASLGALGPVVGVHAAADVSWERSTEEMADLNVGGTLRFARFLEAVSDDPALVYLSTAYTRPRDWQYRNGYEFTKAQAERSLEEVAQRMPVSVFAISLVVGDSKTGRIARHNGIYPVLKALAEYGPPFLVGNKETEIDIVPVDWVCEELLRFVEAAARDRQPRHATAAAGAGRRITFERLVRCAEQELERFDLAHGLTPDPELPLIRSRQWEFLQRCAKAWQVTSGISVKDFRSFERLLKTYSTYSETLSVRDPEGVHRPAPEANGFLPVVCARWLDDNEDRVLRRRIRVKSRAADIRAQTERRKETGT